MDVEIDGLLARFAQARVARLATVGPHGVPHLVPVTFALRNGVVVTAIDHKPKTSTNLKRISNIRSNNRVTLLVDEYDDSDWSTLWWIRVDGAARIVQSGQDREAGLAWLEEKYVQYRRQRPEGHVVWVDVDDVRAWSYTAR